VKLITAHRILIGAGIAFFVFYAVVLLTRDWTTASVAQAIVALAVAGGLVLYYRTLKGWGQRPPS
jgi:hypothetical protein